MMHALIPVLLVALAPQEPDLAKLVSEARLTMSQAIARATHEARSGVATQAELEFEKDHTVWSIDIAQGNKILEVLLDARDGSVLETGEEAEDCSALVKAANLTLTEAVAAVLKQHPGKAVLAQLKSIDGRPTVSVEVFDQGEKATFLVDVADQPKGRQKKAGAAQKQQAKKPGRAAEGEEAEEREGKTQKKPARNAKKAKQEEEEEEGEEAEEREGKTEKKPAGNAKKAKQEEEEEEGEEAEEREGKTEKKPAGNAKQEKAERGEAEARKGKAGEMAA